MLLHDLTFKEAYLKSTIVVCFSTDKENGEQVGYGFLKGHIVRLCSREQQKVLNVLY